MIMEKKVAGQGESEDAPLSERQKERQRARAVTKRVAYLGAGLMAGGFLSLLVALCLLEWRHVNVGGAAAVTRSVIGTDASAVTLANIRWPVSSLGWAGAVGFLGFAICIAAIVIAIAASLSRIADQDF